MNNIVTSLKSGKIRIIGINQSEREYPYVEQCLKDISTIEKFHYKNKNTARYDNCYFGCIIDKIPFYLFVDVNRNKIVVYNFKSKETSYIPNSDCEDIKKILLHNKPATYYIKRNKRISVFHKVTWVILMIMYTFLLWPYCTNRFDDGRFGTIVLNLMIVMGLQDCINVFLPRFERKYYDKIVIFCLIWECIALLSAFSIFLVSGEYNIFSRYINILNIILTIGIIIIKFDKPRNNI